MLCVWKGKKGEGEVVADDCVSGDGKREWEWEWS